MIELFIEYINPIKIIVLLTLIFGLAYLKKNKLVHQYLLLILGISFFTEFTTFFLLYYFDSISLMYSISFIFHHVTWLLLLYFFVENKEKTRFLIMLFLIFGVTNLFFFEGTQNINYYTFILGAFIYLYSFIYESFSQLKKENFAFFLSNDYILLFSPVLFFMGYSFMFAFKDYNVISTIVFAKIELYDFISYFVNIIYYALLNYYIFREKKIRNV